MRSTESLEFQPDDYGQSELVRIFDRHEQLLRSRVENMRLSLCESSGRPVTATMVIRREGCRTICDAQYVIPEIAPVLESHISRPATLLQGDAGHA